MNKPLHGKGGVAFDLAQFAEGWAKGLLAPAGPVAQQGGFRVEIPSLGAVDDNRTIRLRWPAVPRPRKY
jgi:hypothetical protein